MLKIEMRATAYGNVQGVGFRHATKRLAEELKLDGYVKNLPDETVEIVAQGSQEQLESLISALKDNFSIIDLITLFSAMSETYSGFSIKG